MERWELGLKWLGEDIHNYLHKKQSPESNVETIKHQGEPIFQNIVNNYPNQPLKGVKVGFITVAKIILVVILIGLTIKVLLNPEFLVDGVNWIKQVFHAL